MVEHHRALDQYIFHTYGSGPPHVPIHEEGRRDDLHFCNKDRQSTEPALGFYETRTAKLLLVHLIIIHFPVVTLELEHLTNPGQ